MNAAVIQTVLLKIQLTINVCILTNWFYYYDYIRYLVNYYANCIQLKT